MRGAEADEGDLGGENVMRGSSAARRLALRRERSLRVTPQTAPRTLRVRKSSKSRARPSPDGGQASSTRSSEAGNDKEGRSR